MIDRRTEQKQQSDRPQLPMNAQPMRPKCRMPSTAWSIRPRPAASCEPGRFASQLGSIRISGVSRGGGLNGGGGVVSEARVPSFEQWPTRAVERACPDL